MTDNTTLLAGLLAEFDQGHRNPYRSFPSADTELAVLRPLAEAVRQHLTDQPAVAPPVPGVTKVNSLFTVIAVLPGVRDLAWYVAAEQGDGEHWATWYAMADGAGHLYYEQGGLYGSKRAALRDLAERAGIIAPNE